MNTDERIKRHLENTTDGLRARDRLEEVMAEGRRRRVRARTGAVLGFAAVLAAVVTLGSALTTRDGAPTASDPTATATPPTTTATTTATAAGGRPAGALVADQNGVTLIDDTGTSVGQLTSPAPYGEIAIAFADAGGGLVFQHATTPDVWAQGTVLRLAPGASEPTPLVSPPAGGHLVPVGTGRNPTGAPAFFYLQQEPSGETFEVRLMMMDLTSGESEEVLTLADDSDVTVGGSVVAVMDRSDFECPRVRFVEVGSGDVESPLSEDCLPVAAGVSVGPDGEFAAVLANGHLTVASIASGDVRIERDIPGAYMATSGGGGWAVRTEGETVLIGPGGQAALPPVDDGWVVPYDTALDLASDATLGGTQEEESTMPCRPTDVDLPDQDLPAPVADTRDRVFELAAACNYEELAALARSDATTLTFGGDADPVELWVAAGRSGEEPLTILATLLTTTPALDTESGIWAWPAAHVDPSNETSWSELTSIYEAETLDLLRQAEGYLGYRVGIAEDGTWMFFVGGD